VTPRSAGVRRAYAGVFLISAATVILEIALTRIFSFALWYHFAFMSVSAALLGFGVSGVVASLSRRLQETSLQRVCAMACALFGLSTVLALACISAIPLDPAGLGRAWLPSLALALDFLVLTVPFFFSGLTIVTVISRLSGEASRIYCVDLVGGGIGCLLLLSLIGPLGGEGIVLFAGLVGVAAALCFSRPLPQRSRMMIALAATVMMVMTWQAAVLLPVSPKRSRDPSRNKSLTNLLDLSLFPSARSVFAGWNAYSRVDVVEDTGTVAWLRNINFPSLPLPTTQIVIDGDAATSVVSDRGDPVELEYLKVIPSALSYQVLHPRSALVIGAGGGVDALTAVVNGTPQVDAVEINPLIVDLMRGRYAERSGHLFNRPGVTLHLGEGRSFVRSTASSWDLIQLSLIDTWAALSSGAYSLSENYLYTVEAFQDYYRHLTSQGALAITRWYREPPRESLRLCTVAREALSREGIAAPERHFVVYSANNVATIVMKREPVTAQEMSDFRREAERRGFRILYDPETPRENLFQSFFSAPDRAAFYRSLPFDVTPVTDDSPFFFLQHRWKDLSPKALFQPGNALVEIPGKLLLLLVLAISLCFSVVLLLLPLFLKQRSELRQRGSFGLLLYFFGVGVAFMMIEILLMQEFSLFLGHPVYAISVVLFSLLIFSGAGSLASTTLIGDSPRRLVMALAILAGVIVASFALYPSLFAAFLGRPFSVRALVALVAIFPAGFLMGLPFPAGIRQASLRVPRIIPWAWAVNGFASVASSSLCVLLAMEVGFSWAASIAGGCYLACAAVFLIRTPVKDAQAHQGL
jgi:spermidine synthase